MGAPTDLAITALSSGTLALSLVRLLFNPVVSWFRSRRTVTIRVKEDGRSLELNATTADDAEAIVRAFLAEHQDSSGKDED
jgi:hypothetical protein